MIHIGFDEATRVLDPPKGLGAEPLQIFAGTKVEDGMKIMISCWKMTPVEFEEFKKSGRIYLIVAGDSHPLIHLQVQKPEMIGHDK